MKRSRLAKWIVGLLFAGGLLWIVPLVHISSLVSSSSENSSDAADSDGPNATKLAEILWDETLLASRDKAHEAAAVLQALESQPEKAGETYGSSAGLGRGFMLLLRGSGTIVAIQRSHVALAIGDNSEADVLILTGPLFGNALRDGSGIAEEVKLLSSQAKNRLSEELNRLVEERVTPALKQEAEVGKRLRFVGCAEVKVPSRFKRPLKVTPVSITFE